MLSHHEGKSFVEQALQGGAEGYLSKDRIRRSSRWLSAVHRGDPYVSPQGRRRPIAIFGRLRAPAPRLKNVRPQPDVLTPVAYAPSAYRLRTPPHGPSAHGG
jgi:DNA-binding NarL/FixJ family response regulator